MNTMLSSALKRHDSEAGVTQNSKALVFSRQHANRRPIFTLTQKFNVPPNGDSECIREWNGIGINPIVVEHSRSIRGTLNVSLSLPSLNESSSAVAEEQGHCTTTLASHKTGGSLRKRELQLPHAAVTLGTMPFFIASQWATLMYGRSLKASYLVLKVQRAATVRVEKAVDYARNKGEVAIAVTPVNFLLKLFFGSTYFVFAADSPKLIRIDGLLDPRDKKPNGRWHEYMGVIEYEDPVDLSVLSLSEPINRTNMSEAR
jgi:hypothetical protein